jgi:hypothetical protein
MLLLAGVGIAQADVHFPLSKRVGTLSECLLLYNLPMTLFLYIPFTASHSDISISLSRTLGSCAHMNIVSGKIDGWM